MQATKFHTNKNLTALLLLLTIALFSTSSFLVAQETTTDSTSHLVPDSSISKDAVSSKLHYKSTDSIRFDMKNKKVYLFGNVEVYYEDIELKAEEVEINLDSNIVIARGKQDSLGKFYGEPVMKEAGKVFNAHEINTIFKLKKALLPK